MIEQEWLTSTDPGRMLAYLFPPNDHTLGLAKQFRPSERKLRLWAVAMYQAATVPWEGRVPDEWLDGNKSGADNDGVMEEARLWCNLRADLPGDPTMAVRAALLRDIVGNPFRPVTRYLNADDGWGARDLVPWLIRMLRWNNGTVVKMAEAIYQERAFDYMPMMADALEDAGCQEQDILRHCRGQQRCPVCLGCGKALKELDPEYRPGQMFQTGWVCELCEGTGWAPLPGPHVRGCCVLDLLLGKA